MLFKLIFKFLLVVRDILSILTAPTVSAAVPVYMLCLYLCEELLCFESALRETLKYFTIIAFDILVLHTNSTSLAKEVHECFDHHCIEVFEMFLCSKLQLKKPDQ